MYRRLMTVALIAAVAVPISAWAQEGQSGWSLGVNYMRFNVSGTTGEPRSGHTDNVGATVAYDWFVSPNWTMGIQGFGSWDTPVDVYGGGLTLKGWSSPASDFSPYAGVYANWLYADVGSQLGGGSRDGIQWGPLVGLSWKMASETRLFVEYQYGFFEFEDIRKIFDESNTIIAGLQCGF